MREAARLFEPSEFIEGDLNLPLYSGDIENQGMPENVQRLADQIGAADAVVIATPEYNKGISGVLKNALDWVSRVEGNPWLDKPVAILSATAGRTGGESAQFNLRLAMVSFRPMILQGPNLYVASASKEFDEQGRLTNERYAKTLADLMADLRNRI